MFKPPRELLRIENCWRLKKDYPRPTRCCLFSRYMNPFLCKNDMLYKVKNIRLLRLWNGVKDVLISKIDKKLAVLKVHGLLDRGRFKHCWLYMLAHLLYVARSFRQYRVQKSWSLISCVSSGWYGIHWHEYFWCYHRLFEEQFDIHVKGAFLKDTQRGVLMIICARAELKMSNEFA